MGMPNRPVVSIGPEDPAFIVIGEGPGFNETRLGEPFVGASGQVVNKILGKIGRARQEVMLTNATLCEPRGADEKTRQLAAAACKPRLLAELAQFPGKPILTLGAVAARDVIPKAVLDAIEPPDAPKAIRKAQKLRQQPTLKHAIARRKQVNKTTERRLKKLIKHERKRLITICKVQHRARPDEAYLQHEIARVQAKLEMRAREDALKEIEAKAKEREIKKKLAAKNPKKRKPKQVKLTDIVGTLFDIDVDGTGIRPLIPGIHPAALLRGGGASIGGSHTPDMAFVNLIYDALKINALAKGKDVRLKLNASYELFDQERAIDLFLGIYREALEEGALSIDLETFVDDPDRHSALMMYVANIRVIGFATKTQTISIDWNLLPSWCMSLLQLLLLRVETTYHNGLYDRTVLKRHGFLFPPMGEKFFDTLLAHHAAFPGNAHRLQIVAAQFFGVTPWKSEYRNTEETPEKLALYNANDTGATHALRGPLIKAMTKTKTRQVFDLDLCMSDVAGAMHLAGMPVDRDINEELLQTFGKNVHESRQHVEEIARSPKLREQIWHHLALQEASVKRKLDPDDFEERYNVRLSAINLDPDWRWKIGASKHIAALLLAMGVALVQTTASGKALSTQKEVLESLADVPVVRDIIAFRENDKLYSTFVYPMFDRFDPKSGELLVHGFCDDDSRAHSLWSMHKISGRWASYWPVVSNVPKDRWKKVLDVALTILLAKLADRGVGLPDRKEIAGKLFNFAFEGSKFRLAKSDGSISKCIRPNLRTQIKVRPGRKLVGFDFGQIEARVIALISGDPFLCAIFAENRDPHIECARIVWPGFDALDEDTRKQLRENIKSVEYGYLYMAQLETLHKTMLKAGNMIRIEDLALAINKLGNAMPGVLAWQRSTIAMASQPPFELCDHVLGRRRVWPMGQAEGPEAVNAGVQFTAAAIMNQGMAKMFPKLDNYQEADAIAQIHDAAVFECWEDDAERLGRDCKESFETEIERDGRRVPFPIDVKIGDDWSQV